MDYLFDPDVIHECALAGLGRPRPAMFDAVADAMEARYPGRVDRSQPWIYSIAGGAMIQMKLYYASVYEYLMIWGTPIGSEGHSGRHASAFWDTVLDGEASYYAEGQFEKRVHKPGDRIFVGRGQARGRSFTAGLWAVEYARGPLPLSLPFGLADELLSTLDFSTAAQTLGIYMSLMAHHWRQPLADGTRSPSLPRRVAATLLGAIGPAVTSLARPSDATDEIPRGDAVGPSRASRPRPARRLSVAGGDAGSGTRR
jgi:ERG2 and Sigma1 receptor like protein